MFGLEELDAEDYVFVLAVYGPKTILWTAAFLALAFFFMQCGPRLLGKAAKPQPVHLQARQSAQSEDHRVVGGQRGGRRIRPRSQENN